MGTTLNLDAITTLEGSSAETVRIYLVRHGQSTLNVPDEDGVHRSQGTSLKVALTALGEDQARRLCEKLVPKIEHLDLTLISSDALRAKQTVDVFAQHFKKDVVEYPGLRELGTGEWEGQRKEGSYMKASRVWQELSPKDKFLTPKMPGCESPKQAVKRAVTALDDAVKLANGKTILGVCHDSTTNFLYLKLNRVELSDEPGKEPPYVDFSNCDIILIEVPAGKSVKEGRAVSLIKTNIAGQ
jgi:broad specificity phosphatase PhoE